MQQLYAIGVRNLGTGVRTLGRLTSWRKYSLAEIIRAMTKPASLRRAEPRTRATVVACSRRESLLETTRRVSRKKGARKPQMNPRHPLALSAAGRRRQSVRGLTLYATSCWWKKWSTANPKMGDQSLRISRVLLRTMRRHSWELHSIREETQRLRKKIKRHCEYIPFREGE